MQIYYIFDKCVIQRYIVKELEIWTARQRLTSPLTQSGTSTHHTMVTQKSISWTWMDEPRPFRSMLTSHPIPEIRIFQSLTLKVEILGVVKGLGHTVGPISYQLAFFSLHINQTLNCWDTVISKFDLKNPRSMSWLRSSSTFPQTYIFFVPNM